MDDVVVVICPTQHEVAQRGGEALGVSRARRNAASIHASIIGCYVFTSSSPLHPLLVGYISY